MVRPRPSPEPNLSEHFPFMRAAIYARYSSDNQSEASIDDQVRVCRAYVERMGWTATKIYADPEMTGRSAFRPQYQAMLADAESGLFDILISEALDRLSRRVADLAGLKDQLDAAGIKMHAIQLGEINDMHISIFGMMAQQYSKDLGHKTIRGQAGRIEQGKAAGGLSYGYLALPPVKCGKTTKAGERQIVPVEAEILVRIFTMYANGISPEAIVTQLNREGVAGPGGRPWRNTTLRGQGRRGTGTLRVVGTVIPASRRRSRKSPTARAVSWPSFRAPMPCSGCWMWLLMCPRTTAKWWRVKRSPRFMRPSACSRYASQTSLIETLAASGRKVPALSCPSISTRKASASRFVANCLRCRPPAASTKSTCHAVRASPAAVCHALFFMDAMTTTPPLRFRPIAEPVVIFSTLTDVRQRSF